MGATSDSTALGHEGRIYDAKALGDESPIHEVCLDPFFISKYELTQAQWLRLTGRSPNVIGFQRVRARGSDPRLRPAENINWYQANRAALTAGLQLPTEAQWEYAARAGTTAPWWSGRDGNSLADSENLCDQTFHDYYEGAAWLYDSWSDGYAYAAPVGAYNPNPFGLHDVIGNVCEWCRDFYGLYTEPVAEGTGLRLGSDFSDRIIRGGDYGRASGGSRVTRRMDAGPFWQSRIGLRPGRPLLSAEAQIGTAAGEATRDPR